LAQSPVIFGCRSPVLGDWERDFFADADPVGLILFGESCETPDQVRALVGEFRACVGRADAPVLVDQEGGRVQRLGPPHWRAAPAALRIGDLARRDPDKGREAAGLNARLLGTELADVGISVDCAPVLDLLRPETHDVIGGRAFGADPNLVAELGRAFCDGLLATGVAPMIKHMPGHGRAKVDSHHGLPRVDAGVEDLMASDFAPFRRLADAPWAMTAHIVFEAIDPEHPATVSAKVISEVIRGAIGFEGVVVSDDLSMEALSGSLGERAAAVLSAGCDLVLHCSADRDEMSQVAGSAGTISVAAEERLARALACVPTQPARLGGGEGEAMTARLDTLLGEA
jgi:beta-N-acetylhexosaminidase